MRRLALKLVISNDTFLKSKPENPNLLRDEEKIPLTVGEWLEVQKACEYPLGHYQVEWDNRVWYCYKVSSFIEY